jgi:hypothetical protein
VDGSVEDSLNHLLDDQVAGYIVYAHVPVGEVKQEIAFDGAAELRTRTGRRYGRRRHAPSPAIPRVRRRRFPCRGRCASTAGARGRLAATARTLGPRRGGYLLAGAG